EYVPLVKLMEAWRKLYPFEFEPYSTLSSYYQTTIGIDTAIAVMQQAAELSDREQALIKLITLYQSKEDFATAEETLKDLETEYPNAEEIDRRYVSLYRASGEVDRARDKLNEMIAVDPLNANLTFDLVRLEQAAGNYVAAERQARKALEQATSYADSTNMWNGVIRALAGQGQITEALEELDSYEDHISRTAPRIRIVLGNLSVRLNYLIMCGRYTDLDVVVREASTFDKQYTEIYSCYAPIYALANYQSRPEDLTMLLDCEDVIAQMGEGLLEVVTVYRLLLEDKYVKAAELLDEQLERGKNLIPYYLQTSIFREAGDSDRALEIVNRELPKSPQEPLLLLEKAQTLKAMGDTAAAIPLVESVLKTYARADADFVHLQRAQALAAELGLAIN
ncbi:MAG: tetratricopeptide repeat protein, partial [Bacteroidota bacterium]